MYHVIRNYYIFLLFRLLPNRGGNREQAGTHLENYTVKPIESNTPINRKPVSMNFVELGRL